MIDSFLLVVLAILFYTFLPLLRNYQVSALRQVSSTKQNLGQPTGTTPKLVGSYLEGLRVDSDTLSSYETLLSLHRSYWFDYEEAVSYQQQSFRVKKHMQHSIVYGTKQKKLLIINAEKRELLNSRSELISDCRLQTSLNFPWLVDR